MDGGNLAHAHAVSDDCPEEIGEHLTGVWVRAIFEVTNEPALVVVANLPDEMRNSSRASSCNEIQECSLVDWLVLEARI